MKYIYGFITIINIIIIFIIGVVLLVLVLLYYIIIYIVHISTVRWGFNSELECSFRMWED